jgi:hypothetical protein
MFLDKRALMTLTRNERERRPTMELKKDMVKRWKEIEVRILAVDSNPAANVWVCEVADPDTDHMVPRTELAETDEDDLHCDHADGCCRRSLGLDCDQTPVEE